MLSSSILGLTIVIQYAFGQMTCPRDGRYIQSKDSCLIKMYDTNFYDAELQCVRLGGHLPTITNQFVNSEVASFIKDNFCCTAWIGYDDRGVWQNMLPFDYKNYGPGQPNADFRCHQVDPNMNFQWRTANCSMQASFACEVPPIVPNLSCPEGFIYLPTTGFCYRSFRPQGGATWQMANDNCKLIGAQLVSIHSEEENHLVELISSSSFGQYELRQMTWIGFAVNGPANNNFKWSDGTQTNFMKFAPGEPNGPGKENCTIMITNFNYFDRTDLSQWYDNPCDVRTDNYVCKLPGIPVARTQKVQKVEKIQHLPKPVQDLVPKHSDMKKVTVIRGDRVNIVQNRH